MRLYLHRTSEDHQSDPPPPKQVCVLEEFLGLTKEQLGKLLRSEELRIEDEYQVFTASMDWVLHDVAKRKKHVVEVLDPVRFPLLSPQRLFKYIEGTRQSVHLGHICRTSCDLLTLHPSQILTSAGCEYYEPIRSQT